MANLCLNCGIRSLPNTEGSLCLLCKENTQTVNRHFIDCPAIKENCSSLWSNLKTKIINYNQTDGIATSNFITNSESHQKVLLFLRGLNLPFNGASITIIKRFVASTVGKIHKMGAARLRELEAPLLTKYHL